MKRMIAIFIISLAPFSFSAFAAHDTEAGSIDTLECLTGTCYSSAHLPKLTDNRAEDIKTVDTATNTTEGEKAKPTKSETNK